MIFNKFFRTGLFIALLTMVAAAYSWQTTRPTILTNSPAHSLPCRLQTGDVILRDSKGLLGAFFRNMSLQDRKYSHAGFIVILNGEPWVCHYIEQDNGNGLKLEALYDFVHTEKCHSFAVYRYPMQQKPKENLVKLIGLSIHHPFPFDRNFDLISDDKLYCTEWISKTLWKAAHLKIPITKTAGMEYISPDNLYLNNISKLVYQYNYKKEALTMADGTKY